LRELSSHISNLLPTGDAVAVALLNDGPAHYHADRAKRKIAEHGPAAGLYDQEVVIWRLGALDAADG
jgi:hypothetical protein